MRLGARAGGVLSAPLLISGRFNVAIWRVWSRHFVGGGSAGNSHLGRKKGWFVSLREGEQRDLRSAARGADRQSPLALPGETGEVQRSRTAQLRMVPPRASMNHSLASSLVTRWNLPTRLRRARLLATLSPFLLRTTKKSMPKIPVEVSYLIPRSMCSSIPKPKLPIQYNH